VNSIVVDASAPDTLYAGTDVGPKVSNNGGQGWEPLGVGFPIVTVHQLDLNPYTRQLAAGTHGRGAWRMKDAATHIPALTVRAYEPGLPVGPGSLLTYTLTVRNIGNAPATGVTVRNPVPANTTFVSSADGGSMTGGALVWSNLRVPVSGTVRTAFTVRINTTPDIHTGTVITNDGLAAMAAEGVAAHGSPLNVTLAPPFDLTMTPASQLDGTRSGQNLDYVVTVENLGYNMDAVDLAAAGNHWPTHFWDAGLTTPLARTRLLRPGEGLDVAVRVSVPMTATNNTTDEATLTASSRGGPTIHATAHLKTIAVTEQILLVDQDYSGPDVRAYYLNAITRTGHTANVWDLQTSPTLPPHYMRAHPTIVWMTGNATSPLNGREANLAAFLNAGGRLFLCGWDLLDGGAGNTDFVRQYLHINWDNDLNNDIATAHVTAVTTNTVTAGLGTLPLDTTVLGGANFADELQLIAPAQPAFRDDHGKPDALTVQTNRYRLVFLAFPFEGMGTSANQDDLMQRVLNWLGGAIPQNVFLPLTLFNEAIK
jgi:uncharacterized repeat protein (TIGR01451 family)